MSTTGKIAISLLGAGGALGAVSIVESPDGRRVLMELIERAGVREVLQSATEKIVTQMVQAAFGGPRELSS